MSTSAALELIQVTKHYGGIIAVDAIDLKIPARTYCCPQQGQILTAQVPEYLFDATPQVE